MKDQNGTVHAYEFDHLGRLVFDKVTTPGTGVDTAVRCIKRKYEVRGMIARIMSYSNTHNWQCVEERATADDSDVPAPEDLDPDMQYVWGLRYIDDLVLRDRDTSDPKNGTLDERLYAMQDANWNVVAVAESDGDVVERYLYSAYGDPVVLNSDFSEDSDGTDYAWEFRFTGRRTDLETDLIYYRNRMYHPGLGRFVSRDPEEYYGGIHLLNYVGNAPMQKADPLGLTFIGTTGAHYWGPGWTREPAPPVPVGGKPGSTTPVPIKRPAPPKYIPSIDGHPVAPISQEAVDAICKSAYDYTVITPEVLDRIAACKCAVWVRKQQQLGSEWLSKLPACPCSVDCLDPTEWDDLKPASPTFHPPGDGTCTRSEAEDGAGQQCCYDKDGNLITHGLGAGTPDYHSPDASVRQHWVEDVKPFLDCKRAGLVEFYLAYRPPNNSLGCEPNP